MTFVGSGCSIAAIFRCLSRLRIGYPVAEEGKSTLIQQQIKVFFLSVCDVYRPGDQLV